MTIFFGSSIAQNPAPPSPKPFPKTKPVTGKPEIPDTTDPVSNDDLPFEKTIAVDDEVIINLCVSEGNIKINGWERDELRVFINQGSKAGFKVHSKNSSNNPSKVTILGYDPTKTKGKEESQCISGEQIELDVPTGANLNLTGVEGNITVSVQSITKAIIKINEGNIRLQGIGEKISAKTFDGNIWVADSTGDMDLDTTNGSILAYNLEPKVDDDSLKLKTNNGSIVMQSSQHSIIEASSITGSIKFSGEIKSDGQYVFRNTNGQILLEIPEDSSGLFEVLSQKNRFQYGNFKFVTYNISNAGSTMQMVNARMGDGEATISLQTQNGRITLVKRN